MVDTKKSIVFQTTKFLKMCSKKILILIACSAIWASCSKTLEPGNSDFEVVSQNSIKQPTTTFKAGDTVNFVFSGNPDQITFFSGEAGRRYEYRTRTADSTSSIDTLRFWNTVTNAGNGSMQLLASTSFPGYTQINSKDSANVLASYPAGWTDITNRGTWSTGSGAMKSNIGLNDFAAAGKPVFLAFRYVAAAGTSQSSWNINTLGLRHYTADTSYCIDSSAFVIPTGYPASAVSPGWGVVSIFNPLIKFTLNNFNTGPSNNGIGYSPASATNTSVITIPGNTDVPTTVTTETWLISGPINLYRVLPDGGVAIKDMTTNASTSTYSALSSWASYAYVFKKPGNYNVTFFAGTATKDAQNSVVKTITITVQ
jgi:hypothetical protein